MKQIKFLATYAALFFSICIIFLFRNNTEVHAGKFETCSVSYIQSVSEVPDLSPGYTKYTVASGKGKNSTVSYFRFTLDKDSWVRLTGFYSMYAHDGAGTRVDIWQYDKEFTGFMKKGTYFVSVSTSKENYRQDFNGNVNVIVAAARVSTLFDFKAEVGKKHAYAKVSIPDVLGGLGKKSPVPERKSRAWPCK